ncbi:MAG: 7,8-didemethyl-8-hydroxy-5-deazariboflavin synthase CofG [Deltaproteobacteria bacterium]
MTDPARLALQQARSGKGLSDNEAYTLTQIEADRTDELLAAAAAVRDRRWPTTLTYSPKVFLPVTNLCRDRCTYCTFRRDPGQPGEWTMSPAEISDWSVRGRRLGCIEALMCLGDKPEVAFRGFKDLLGSYGCNSTAEYVALACRLALDEGLLPHTNAGLLSKDEMAMLRPLNVSMGLMLENISPRLRGRGMPHAWAPDKEPSARLQMIEEAGQLRIPFTTGILIGIGETEAERIASLLAIRGLHRRYGHIQEVIVQNFRAKPETGMSEASEPGDDEMVRSVAIARLILGEETSLQAPPNLSPAAHRRLIHAGINDWGGISPLTMDYVNPEAPWPHIDRLAETCGEEGFELVPRLPVYDEFLNDEFMAPAMTEAVAARSDTRLEASAS